MLEKIKKLFSSKPSKYDQLIFNEVVELRKLTNTLDNHLIALARLTLIKPDRLHKESINIRANNEYLQSLIRAKNVKSEG